MTYEGRCSYPPLLLPLPAATAYDSDNNTFACLLDPSRPETFDFLASVWGEIASMFPDQVRATATRGSAVYCSDVDRGHFCCTWTEQGVAVEVAHMTARRGPSGCVARSACVRVQV